MKLQKVSTEQFDKQVEQYENWQKSEPYAPMFEPISVLDTCQVQNASLSGRNLSGLMISECLFEEVEFIDCNLFGIYMYYSTFLHCRFVNCNFNKSQLVGCNFTRSDFIECTFLKAELSHSNLFHADFTNADFTGAFLFDSDFRFAYLEGVRLENAKIADTKFYTNQRFIVPKYSLGFIQNISTSKEGKEKLGLEALANIFVQVE